MSDNVHEVIFYETDKLPFTMLDRAVREWLNFNNTKIEIVSDSRRVDKKDEFLNDYRRSIYIKYCASNNVDPATVPDVATCNHTTIHNIINPTCCKEGYDIEMCTKCGYILGIKILPRIHHKWILADTIDPRCLANGSKVYKCSMCGIEYSDTIPRSALGHDFIDNWKTLINPTCCKEGKASRKCTRCDSTENKVLPIIKHNWNSNNDGTHTCIVHNGCNVTENCFPNTPGAICEKCGYRFPSSGNIPPIDDPELELTIDTVTFPEITMNNAIDVEISHNKPDKGRGIWSLTDGELPLGIELTSDGHIKGSATSAGNFRFTIQVDLDGEIVSNEYSLYIAQLTFTVVFDTTGGITSESSRIVNNGDVIGDLPEVTKEGFIFGGWFTSITDGLKIDNLYTISSDVTLYARWANETDDNPEINFGDATSRFNMKFEGDRTNYNDNDYTIYHRNHDDGEDKLSVQIGISSSDGTNNMTSKNKNITLYMKVTNKGESGSFDIGFDCDSFVPGYNPVDNANGDMVIITRIDNGIRVGDNAKTMPTYAYTVTAPYDVTAWLGTYNTRTENRYKDMPVGSSTYSSNKQSPDSGYCFNMNNIHISKNSYAILEINFDHS